MLVYILYLAHYHFSHLSFSPWIFCSAYFFCSTNSSSVNVPLACNSCSDFRCDRYIPEIFALLDGEIPAAARGVLSKFRDSWSDGLVATEKYWEAAFIAVTTTSDNSSLLGVFFVATAPVIKGMLGGSSKLWWWPLASIRAHRRNWGSVYFPSSKCLSRTP